MHLPATVFREYDIRGLVGTELTPRFARALGAAFAAEAARRIGGQAPTLAVGRDNRPSGATLAAGVREGIVAVGGVALDVGELPTPALYFAEHHLEADGCLQVTGSHNPPEFNGFKMVIQREAVHGQQISVLRDAMTAESAPSSTSGVERATPGVLDAYRRAIVERNPLIRPVRVVVDCGNGVASLIAVSTLEATGADVIPLFCDSDGTFPNHHPDPTVPENLKDVRQRVVDSGAELGIAFDGDGDRIGAVDEHGRIIWGDQLLIVLGRDLIDRFGPGEPVIFDVKCSELLPEALRTAGAEPVMWKTGHSLIKAKMKELNAKLAGEMSGHMFFGGDWYGFDDALFAAARLLQIVSSGPPGLARLLADLPETFTTPELRVPCPEEQKFTIVQDAVAHFGEQYRVNPIDGVRIAFPDGWGLLRASNTQPVLVLRFEATSDESLARYRAEVFDWLATRGIQA